MLYTEICWSSSHILLDELRSFGEYEHNKWVPKDYFEYCSLGREGDLRPPLEVAATGLWFNLVNLLIENGADPRARAYNPAKCRRDVLARGAFDEKPSKADLLLYADQDVPELRPILSNLLATDDKDRSISRRLQGARYLLTRCNMVHQGIVARTVEELHVFLRTSTRLMQTPDQKLSEEVAAIWSILTTHYRNLPVIPKDRKRGLVFMSATDSNASGLKCFLALGFPANGRWWQRCSLTPYDVVTCQQRVDDPEERAQCVRLLRQHGAYRGPFYSVEVQLFWTIVFQILVACFSFVGYLMLRFLSYCFQGGIKMLYHPDGNTSMLRFALELTLAAIPVYLVYMVAFLGISLTTAPLLLSLAAAVNAYIYRPSIAAAVLHISPVAWFLTLLLHDGDFEAITSQVYGPAVSLLKAVRRYQKPHNVGMGGDELGTPLPQSERVASPSDQSSLQLPSIGDEIQSSRFHSGNQRPESKQQRRIQGFSQHLVGIIDASISNSIISVKDGLVALSRQFQARKGNRPKRRFTSVYNDDDDNEARLSLLGNMDEESGES